MMKSNKLFFIVLIVFLFLLACETKLVKGKVDSIETERGQQNGYWMGSPWYSPPIKTGYVVVKCDDGKKIRCKNPYPDISEGDAVSIKEMSSGEWVIAKYNITSN